MGIDQDIQQASFKLYETALGAKEKNNPDLKKLTTPSKLLYMAGSAAETMMQKQDICNIFNAGLHPASAYEQVSETNLWSSNRMLGTDEMDAAMNNITPEGNRLSINYPQALIRPGSDENLLTSMIETMLNLDQKNQVFPVITGEHWVLFCLYQDQSDREKKCVVFNSNTELNEAKKRALIDSANAAGVSDEKNIKFIDGDMQENVPNGCGVFVVKAFERLCAAPEKTPLETLEEFVEDFTKKSAEEQNLFNIQNRRQLYETTIENRRPTERS